MPRRPREKSQSGIYHIMLRGINQQNIFENDEDYEKFIDILYSYKNTINFEIYAYCLMGNHVHLLMKEGKEDISNTMRRIGTSYACWYNWQYGRKGHLFQDRYRSEAVEDDAYLLTVLRYIHQNPMKAELVKNIMDYKWSSYKEYINDEGITDTAFVLDMFDKDRSKAISRFVEFNQETSDACCLDITETKKTLSDREIKQLVLEKYKFELATLHNQSADTQKEVLRYLKKLGGTSLRQLARITGFTVNKIFRA